MVESGFADLDVTPAKRAEQIEGNREGWEIKLGHLHDYAGRVRV